MFIFRIIGLLITLAMAGLAVLAVIYGFAVWAVVWVIGSLTIGVLSLTRRKKIVPQEVHN